MQYVQARSCTVYREYADEGVSGAKDRRPALDQLVTDAKSRRFDVLVCSSLDRLGRSLKHLIVLLDDLHALAVGLISACAARLASSRRDVVCSRLPRCSSRYAYRRR